MLYLEKDIFGMLRYNKKNDFSPQLIGANNILSLLQKLNKADSRYQPSPFLIKEVIPNK